MLLNPILKCFDVLVRIQLHHKLFSSQFLYPHGDFRHGWTPNGHSFEKVCSRAVGWDALDLQKYGFISIIERLKQLTVNVAYRWTWCPKFIYKLKRSLDIWKPLKTNISSSRLGVHWCHDVCVLCIQYFQMSMSSCLLILGAVPGSEIKTWTLHAFLATENVWKMYGTYRKGQSPDSELGVTCQDHNCQIVDVFSGPLMSINSCAKSLF